MRTACTLLLILITNIVSATNYFVATNGNDGNDGKTMATAWKTIAKVNSYKFNAYDAVYFNCGDIFKGRLNANRSFMYFGYYGTGAKPEINGMTTLTAWVSKGGGVYECAVPTLATSISMFTLNGTPQELGRYPNSDAANGGYFTYEAANGKLSITDNQLASDTNWTGADVVIRKNNYIIQRSRITNHSGHMLTYNIWKYGQNDNYNNPAVADGVPGFGYYIQNSIKTLDKPGEFFFDSVSKKISVYFGATNPNTLLCEVATTDVLMSIGVYNNITVDGLSFKGCNWSGIQFTSTYSIGIQNCDLKNIGFTGIQGFSVYNSSINNCNVDWALHCGLQLYSGNSRDNLSIMNSTATHIGQYPGNNGVAYDGGDMVGILIRGRNYISALYNKVEYTGGSGIVFQGGFASISYNQINYYCSRLNDQGAIYVYEGGTDAAPDVQFFNRIISNNIIGPPAVGAGPGTLQPTITRVIAIYLDGRTRNVWILNNIVYDQVWKGTHSNNGDSVFMYGNIYYNCARAIAIMKWSWGSLSNLRITGNLVYARNSDQISLHYENADLDGNSVATMFGSVGVIDSNWYNNTENLSFQTLTYLDLVGGVGIGGSTLRKKLADHQAAYGFDLNSNVIQATGNGDTLVTNRTKITATIPLGNKRWRDVKTNIIHNGFITLDPFTGAVLQDEGAILVDKDKIRMKIVNKN